MYSVILVPVDGSKHAEKAVEHAVALAKSFGSKIILLHVVDTRQFHTIDSESANRFHAELRHMGDRILSDMAKKVKAAGVEVEAKLREGVPVTEIVMEAEELRADLIVMGTRGLTGTAHAVLGSTAEQTIRWAPCPVMVIK